MPDAVPPPSQESHGNGSSLEKSLAIPSPIKEAIEQIPDQQAKAILSIFALSRTSLGPDPETAKIAAQAEMHQETCRLDGYRTAQQYRDTQNQRDHEFRQKKLNHQSLMSASVLAISLIGILMGLMFSDKGNPTLGTPILVASLTLLSGLAGKLLSSREKD